MRDFYKEFLCEIDDISEAKTLDTATFTYGFIWGRVVLARELQLISADQMEHIQKVADEAFEDCKDCYMNDDCCTCDDCYMQYNQEYCPKKKD